MLLIDLVNMVLLLALLPLLLSFLMYTLAGAHNPHAYDRNEYAEMAHMESGERERLMAERDWLLRRRESKRVVFALVLAMIAVLASIARFVIDLVT